MVLIIAGVLLYMVIELGVVILVGLESTGCIWQLTLAKAFLDDFAGVTFTLGATSSSYLGMVVIRELLTRF